MRQVLLVPSVILHALAAVPARTLRWLGRRGRLRPTLAALLVPVFLVATLVPIVPPQIAQPVKPAHAAVAPEPDNPRDPLSASPLFSQPFLSLSVDVRTRALRVQVVDAAGPGLGQAGKIIHSLTSTTPPCGGDPTGHAWAFNHQLRIEAVIADCDGNGEPDPARVYAVGPDGGRTPLEFDAIAEPAPPARWAYYRSKGGPWFRVKLRETCTYWAEQTVCGQWAPAGTGPYYQYLPGGGYREFDAAGLVVLERDANGNQTTYDRTSGVRLTDQIGRVTTSNAATNPTAATDPYGRQATFAYDAAGRMSTSVNLGGSTIQYTYTNGLLTRLTDARGNAYTIAYDAGKRVTGITYPDGSVVSYAFTVDVNCLGSSATAVTDPRGNVTKHCVRDAKGVLKWGGLIDALGHRTQVDYDTNNNIEKITDPQGRITRFEYNAHRFLTKITNAQGKITQYGYDGSDRLTSITDPLGRISRFAYDSNHNLTSITNALNQVTTYTYTPWGAEASVTDARGNSTTYEYDARRRLTRVVPPSPQGPTTYGYDTFDNQTTVTDALNHTTAKTFGAMRQVLSVTDALGNVSRYAYDASGNPTSVTDPKGNVTVTTYDSRDRIIAITQPGSVTTRYAYDPAGNLTQITLPNGRTVQMAYDARDDLIRVTDSLGQVTATTYDEVGNVRTVADRKGITTTNAYDSLYRLVSESAGGQTISYTYDDAGNRLTMTDPTGTTAYQYDALNRLTRVTSPDGRSIAYTHDAVGNRATMTNPAGQTTTYTYDPANRVTTIADPTGTTAFAYDAAGNRTGQTLSNGATTTYTYTANNWLATLLNRDRSGTILSQFAYTYDPNGNRTQIQDQSGISAFAHDLLNQLTQAAYPDGKTVRYIYDAVGNRTQMVVNATDTAPPAVTNTSPAAGATQVPLNTQIAVHFTEPVDRGSLVMTASPGITFGEPAWSNGDRTATFSVPLNGSTTYSVSARARDTAGNLMPAPYSWSFTTAAPADTTPPVLTNVSASPGSGVVTVTWTTDEPATSQVQYGPTVALGTWTRFDTALATAHTVRVTACEQVVYYRAYSRDAAGNLGTSAIQSVQAGTCPDPNEPPPEPIPPPPDPGPWPRSLTTAVTGPTSAQAEPTGTTTYTYDANNRLTQRVAPDGATTFTYDPNGNLTQYAEPSSTRAFAYDPWDQMTSVTSGSVTVTYTYDGAGQKVRRQGPSGGQKYYYDYFSDVPRILAEADAGSGTFQTVYSRDLFGNLLSDGLTWHQFDGLGSVVSRTNSSGALVGSTLYGAWGTVRSQSGTQGKWGFTGAEYDPDARGYHIGARWYDPSLGRWWAEDPLQDKHFEPATLNFYAYSYNRPTIVVDRNGREGCEALSPDSQGGGGGGCGSFTGNPNVSVRTVTISTATADFYRVVALGILGSIVAAGLWIGTVVVAASTAEAYILGGMSLVALTNIATAVQSFLNSIELREGWTVVVWVEYDPATDTYTVTTIVYDENGVEKRRNVKQVKDCQGYHENNCNP